MFRLMLALGFAAIPTVSLAADDKDTAAKPPPLPPLKAPDYSGYTPVGDVVGEVVKCGDDSVTIRVTWMVSQRSQSRSRPRLSSGNRNYRNPYSMNRTRTTLKPEHHDYQLEFVPESQVRFRQLPPKFDEQGKKTNYTAKELDQLKQPFSLPGYRAEKSDLVPGTVVELYVMRDKSIPAAKASENDLRVKYLIILGQDPNPPKDITSPSKAPPKK